MRLTPDIELSLNNLKNKILLSKSGEIYCIFDWPIKNIIKKRFFSKAEPQVIQHIDEIYCFFSKHKDTTFHGVMDCSSYNYIPMLLEDRERYLSMKTSLEIFGFEIIKIEKN